MIFASIASAVGQDVPSGSVGRQSNAKCRFVGQRRLIAAASALSLVSACSGDQAPADDSPPPQAAIPTPTPTSTAGPTPTPAPSPAIGVQPVGTPTDVATVLNIPWSVIMVGDEVLVSERNRTDIVAFRPGQAGRSLGIVPNVTAGGDGGLLGLASLDRDGRTWIYAYHTTSIDNRIVRMVYASGSLGPPEAVLSGIPFGRGHNGSRIGFGPDRMLYATVGDTQNSALAQDRASLAGKILRMTPEGGVPADNPIAGSLVYSIGHRNPQGLAWDNQGRLWATEFGDNSWDELNLIGPGRNYGWPIVEGTGDNPTYVNPVVQWRTSEMGPSGMAYVDSTFFIAGLTGGRLWSVSFDAGRPVTSSYYTGQYGRIRDVVRGRDGNLWFLTNRTDGREQAQPGDDRVLSVALTQVR